MPFHLVETKSIERMSLDQMLDRGIDLQKACHMFPGVVPAVIGSMTMFL